MSVLIFFAVLFVLILVHEWGHFIVAKKTGMRVDEFGIGFPPKLFGYKKGETEYTFNVFPIGGFVRILGEDGTNVPSSPVSDEDRDARSERSEAEQGGLNADEGDDLPEADRARNFTARPKWAQAAVLIAGVTMNIVFAWFLFVLALMIGSPASVATEDASPNAVLVVSEVLTDSPAAEAGLLPGMRVSSVISSDGDISELTPEGFSAFVAENASEDITLAVRNELGEQSITVTSSTGVLEAEPDTPAVGVAITLTDIVREPLHTALWQATTFTGSALVAITVGITNLLVDAVMFNADLTQVAGPVGIVGMVGDAAEFGFTSLLMFTAFISLNLAVINMLPFPALDGGRLLFVGIEAITRRPINPIWQARLNLIGFVLLILLMVAVTYNDILRIL